MVDCLIVGSGIAGISAALTLLAEGRSFLLLGEENLSKKTALAERIFNYPAFCGGTGEEFRALLKKQLADCGIEIKNGRATGVYAMQDKIVAQTDQNEWIEAKSVILATGVSFAAAIEGEERFLGRGVSYCATCDGALYKGKTVVATATSATFEKDAEVLEEFAGKFFYVPTYPACTFAAKKSTTEVFTDGLLKIEGKTRAERAVFKHREIEVDGIFLLKDVVPFSALCGGLKTDGRHVEVDRAQATNLKGIFAAGDCTGRPYQYAKAAGEGNVAAHSVSEYLKAREK